jgi:hypothetical protein
MLLGGERQELFFGRQAPIASAKLFVSARSFDGGGSRQGEGDGTLAAGRDRTGKADPGWPGLKPGGGRRLSCSNGRGKRKLNAVVRRMDEEALVAADAADAARAQGNALGPLHGVPVTIKVNPDQKGHPTDNGVVAFRGLIAPDDAPVGRQPPRGRRCRYRPHQCAGILDAGFFGKRSPRPYREPP